MMVMVNVPGAVLIVIVIEAEVMAGVEIMAVGW
jgi:hypothetical protein